MTEDQTPEIQIEEVPEDQGEGETDVKVLEPESNEVGVLESQEAAVEVVEAEVVEEEEEEEEEIDELTALRQELEAAQAQADEYLDDLRRERAAFQNYKKRQENERAELWQMAQAELLVQILPIRDDMERALEVVPEEQADQPWVEGILLIQRKLQATLEGIGVALVEAVPGQPFDPFIHEAVSYEEHQDYEEGQIIAVVQKGHKLGERVLRPAMVRVAR